MPRIVHIIGAGVSGLAAAVRLADAGCTVRVHEATHQAGGRCRTYYDGATDLMIDNGNHLLLSGNRHVLAYADKIGSRSGLVGPARAVFDFADLADGKRWQIDLGTSKFPGWLFDPARRVPDTNVADYLKLLPLIWSPTSRLVGDAIPCEGTLYRRLTQPLLLAALNVDPPEGSAGLAGAIVRETLLAGGASCRPLIARDGLSTVLVDPAIAWLQARDSTVQLGHELRGVTRGRGCVESLNFGDEIVPLGAQDAVILAVPPRGAATLLPGTTGPTEFRAIVNAHFRFTPPPGCPALTGVVGSDLVEWLFAFPDRLSVTISNGDRYVNAPREQLAQDIWRDVCAVAQISADLPRWQIVRERRATFASTPKQHALRPPAKTGWRNAFLAGDWTDTGLPATIEGSVRSGDRAADLVLGMT